MKTFKDILNEKDVYDFSSIQADINPSISSKIKKFAESIPKKDIYDEDGIVNDHHVTVKYGYDSKDWKKVESVIEGYGETKLRLGKMSIFDDREFDVLKIEVESRDLRVINEMLGKQLKFSGETFKIFNPHVTVAYMKKGTADKYVGNETFKNITNDFYELTFSSKDGNKYKMKL